MKKGQLDKCLRRNPDGSLWRDPKTKGLMLDPEIADLEWEQNVGWHPNSKRHAPGESPPAEPADVAPPTPAAEPSASRYAEAPTVAAKPKQPATNTRKYMENRGTRELYLAEMARLDYEERLGQLVAVDDVTNLLSKVVSETKTRILAVPGKAKSMIPHLTVEDVLTLDELLRDALKELADAKPV